MLLILLGFFLLDPQRAPHQFVLTEYSVEKGLPHSAVCSVLQSQNGYLWVGTQDGLARFDGIQFLEEDFSQSGQHSSPFFNVLTKDPQGRIWAGTRSGGILVWSKAHRVVLGSGTGLSDPQVLCFSPSQAGGMYVGTPSGIFLVDPLLTQVTDLQFWQENRQVVQCMVLWQGQLMIGTDTGLWRLAPDGRPQRTVLDYTSVTALYVDRDDHLWIGTEAVGLLCWAPGDSPVAFERKDNANPQFITAFCQDSDGILWIGTHHQGMFRQYGGQLSRVDFHNRFTESRIFSIIEDREGSLWVGTHFGLVQIQDAAFKLIGKQEGIEEDAIWSIQQGPSGSMLFASEGGGLKIYQAGLIHTIGKDDGLSSSDTISVLTARDGAIWVGTRKGLNRVDKNEIRVFGPEQGLTSDYVRALHEDHSGRIWIGTVAGCFIWDGNHFSILSTSTGLIHNTVRCFFEDDRNTIWIGTDGGISRVFQDGYIQNFSTQNGLLSSFVRCLVPAVDGGVWVGTYGGGLHYFGRDLRIAQLTRQQGLYYDIVFDIVRDEEGWLWGGTSKGIFRAKETDMLAVVRGERDQFSSEVFGEPRNPIRLDVTGGVWPLATRDSSGQIWFPTYRGAVVFNPTIVPKTTAPPKPIIFSFRVDGAERIDQPTPELSPGTDRLEFHYASLTFRAPGKIQYAHKLEGYDQEWVMAGTRRIGFYNNLGPGDYRFLVRAQSDDGTLVSELTDLSFRIQPKFFQTKWFFFGLLLLVVLGPVLFGLSRERYLRRRSQWLEATVTERTRALEMANNNLEQTANTLRSTQRQLVDAAHMAGMAEIATDVLHNVGNTLNSVNVSSAMIDQYADEIRPDLLIHTAELIQSQTNLAHFFEGKQGKLIPDFLLAFSKTLRERKIHLQEESKLLRNKIENIREIVASQQQYASMGIEEDLDINQLLLDAERVLTDAFNQPKVAVVNDLGDLPLVAGQKSKLFQIFINLIKNAIEALATQPDHPTLRVRSRLEGEWIQIEIIDNGHGIQPEHLKNIFTYGFTTKKEGHGFGLHFCANAMNEMGGNISVSSEGTGKGCSFNLKIPLKHP